MGQRVNQSLHFFLKWKKKSFHFSPERETQSVQFINICYEFLIIKTVVDHVNKQPENKSLHDYLKGVSLFEEVPLQFLVFPWKHFSNLKEKYKLKIFTSCPLSNVTTLKLTQNKNFVSFNTVLQNFPQKNRAKKKCMGTLVKIHFV